MAQNVTLRAGRNTQQTSLAAWALTALETQGDGYVLPTLAKGGSQSRSKWLYFGRLTQHRAEERSGHSAAKREDV